MIDGGKGYPSDLSLDASFWPKKGLPILYCDLVARPCRPHRLQVASRRPCGVPNLQERRFYILMSAQVRFFLYSDAKEVLLLNGLLHSTSLRKNEVCANHVLRWGGSDVIDDGHDEGSSFRLNGFFFFIRCLQKEAP